MIPKTYAQVYRKAIELLPKHIFTCVAVRSAATQLGYGYAEEFTIVRAYQEAMSTSAQDWDSITISDIALATTTRKRRDFRIMLLLCMAEYVETGDAE